MTETIRMIIIIKIKIIIYLMTYNARYMKICSQAHYDQKQSQKSSLLFQ